MITLDVQRLYSQRARYDVARSKLLLSSSFAFSEQKQNQNQNQNVSSIPANNKNNISTNKKSIQGHLKQQSSPNNPHSHTHTHSNSSGGGSNPNSGPVHASTIEAR